MLFRNSMLFAVGKITNMTFRIFKAGVVKNSNIAKPQKELKCMFAVVPNPVK